MYKAGKRKRNLKKLWLIVLVVVFIGLVSATAVIRNVYYQNLKPVNGSKRSVLVNIPLGATIPEISATLEKQGVIRAKWAFEWYIQSRGLRESLQAGTYSLHPSQSVPEIVNILTEGKVDTDLVTILPGKRLDEIRDSLINKYQFNASEVEAALKPSNYADEPALADKPPQASLEGYLYPESFEKTASTKPETIIRSSLKEMRKNLTPEIRASFIKQGLTVHEGVILASIVEQEVGDPKKPGDPNYRPIVAQVFLRRIRENMQLGSDVTAFYGAVSAGQSLTDSQAIRFDSPYNTRIHSGIPPGPISNVSASSLRAVAFPANTNYLYFVAGDDGITYFSNTITEHEALTRAHCKKLCQ